MGKITCRELFAAALLVLFSVVLLISLSSEVQGAPFPEIKLPDIRIGAEKPKDPDSMILPFQMLAIMTLLSLAPYILVMTTCFIRVTMVLSFLRTAMGTQQVPPTQVMMGLALFITFYIIDMQH